MRSGAAPIPEAWEALARGRRVFLGGILVVSASAAGYAFTRTLPVAAPPVAAVAVGTLFTVLFAWIVWGALLAVAGYTLLRRRAPHASPSEGTDPGGDGRGRTAIVFPICDEETERTFAGLEATYRSLAETRRLDEFDIYVLSDSKDPETWIAEETAWAELCRAADGFGRLFYRRRRAPAGGKAENIAEFCRHWGRGYRYMVVLDADSVMAGSTILRLVDLMEARPDAGIIQTLSMPVNRSSLFARVRQFAGQLYGPLFAAGLHYWQLGDGVYWGHNAILRVEPFMASCGLPRLPGTPPLGGQIMSHDFVEAALMRRAGWTVWLAWDLEGSYEEVPPTLPDHLRRDRRWCRGNLQHARLLGLPGLSLGHRLHFLLGICAYGVAPLWMLFLIVETVLAAGAARPGHGPAAAAPLQWPWAMTPLLAVTAAMLLLPRALALADLLTRRDAVRSFGGSARCLASAVLELLFSALVAPVFMLGHSWAVVSILSGAMVRWTSQPRRDYTLPWRDACRGQAGVTALGAVWTAAAVRIRFPVTVEWMLPTLAGLLLSIPLAVYSSSVTVGGLARRWGLFLTPDETQPARVLRDLRRILARPSKRAPARPRGNAFERTVVDPHANAHHIWQLLCGRQERTRGAGPLVEKALRRGPDHLDAEEEAALLEDPEGLASLHLAVWSAPDAVTRRWWSARPQR